MSREMENLPAFDAGTRTSRNACVTGRFSIFQSSERLPEVSNPDNPLQQPLRFDGSDYIPAFDDARLTGQLLRVFSCMKDGKWRTLAEIECATGDPQASISAQLRHLRKERFGLHTVAKQPRGDRKHGLFEYRLEVNA